MKLNDLKKDEAICQECKGKANEAYFKRLDGDEIEVLAIICTPCKEVFEAGIRSMARAFCYDPNCDQH